MYDTFAKVSGRYARQLSIHEDTNGATRIPGLTQCKVRSKEEALACLAKALKVRFSVQHQGRTGPPAPPTTTGRVRAVTPSLRSDLNGSSAWPASSGTTMQISAVRYQCRF